MVYGILYSNKKIVCLCYTVYLEQTKTARVEAYSHIVKHYSFLNIFNL